MYWDALTATGLYVSLLMTLSLLYLILRDRPGARRRD
jgi:hypothetical protein